MYINVDKSIQLFVCVKIVKSLTADSDETAVMFEHLEENRYLLKKT